MAESVENVYSSALFELCSENNLLDEVFEDLKGINSVLFADEQAEFVEMLSSPLVENIDKVNVLKKVFGGRINDLTLDFLCVLTEKGRIMYLPAVTSVYKDMYNEKKNILEVKAVTAEPLSEALKKKLLDKLTTISGKTIVLTEEIDKSIIGGIVLKYGNTQIDSSVKTKIDNLFKKIGSVIA